MRFGEALENVLNGRKSYRCDWNRPAFIVKKQVKIGIGTTYVDQIIMVMKDGRMNAYTPSQCDMITNDWMEVRF